MIIEKERERKDKKGDGNGTVSVSAIACMSALSGSGLAPTGRISRGRVREGEKPKQVRRRPPSILIPFGTFFGTRAPKNHPKWPPGHQKALQGRPHVSTCYPSRCRRAPRACPEGRSVAKT